MKQKDAVKLSIAIACLVAAGLILYLTMRESPQPTPIVAPPVAADSTPAPAAKPDGTQPENLTMEGVKTDRPARPTSPIRAAPGGK